ncbi:MAG TPA: outer membrane beta-barrel protein [Phycisphaerae bacterium]|nr:outer membrane beta-barrel protein [Phycisphaerae bacterium]
MAVVALLASTGFAMADTTQVKTSSLSLDPSVLNADVDAAPSTPLMQGLDKIGAAKPLTNLGLNLYGWVEAGYTLNLRQQQGNVRILPGPFTQEPGNHVELNQVDLRLEKIVDPTKWDVGGLVEVLFGTDSNYIRSNGIEYQTFGDNPGEVPQFEIPQAYVDVNVPVGKGLKVRAGKFATLLGTETIDPRGNAFYTHSYLFNLIPFTQTGVLGFYQINDNWSVIGGITRGWDQATEDNNGSPDVTGQIGYTMSKQLQFLLNFNVGPEDTGDTSHYRTTIDPIVVWKVTDQLKLNAEGLYNYDGGFNGFAPAGFSHAYGDDYGIALYGSYMINDYVTANARLEWAHGYLGSLGGLSAPVSFFSTSAPTLNAYELTLGVTVKPMPKDPIGQNLMLRPEIRYDVSEDHVYPVGSGAVYRDQWTAAMDVIFTF